MKEKKVHVVWLAAYQVVFSVGTPQQMLWDQGCFVIIFCDENRVVSNIPVSHILRWTEYEDAEVDRDKQAR